MHATPFPSFTALEYPPWVKWRACSHSCGHGCPSLHGNHTGVLCVTVYVHVCSFRTHAIAGIDPYFGPQGAEAYALAGVA